MKRSKVSALLLVAVALLVPLVGLVVPEPYGSTRTGIEFDVYMYVSLATTLVFVAAAILFTQGFSGFTVKLKRAYGALCTGLALYGIAQLQIPILTITNQLESVWTRSGLIALAYVAALVALYWGMRQFARLIGVKSRWTSPWFTLAFATTAAILSIFVPHFGSASTEVAFDSIVSFSTWGVGLLVACIVLAIKTKRIAGVTYTNALAWMLVAFWGVGVVAAHYLLTIILLGDRSNYAESIATIASYMFSGLLFVRAAYAFNAISWQPVSSDVQRNFFGYPVKNVQASQVTSTDIVVYTAQLASSTTQIEPILNQLRALTASLSPGTEDITPADTTKLMDMYLHLEEYLINDEPLRKFDKASLRHEVVLHLKLNADSRSTFWSQLPK